MSTNHPLPSSQESTPSLLLLRLDHDRAAGRVREVTDSGILHVASRGVHSGGHHHRDARHGHPHGLEVVGDHQRQHAHCWAARRSFHGHDFWHYVGVTDRLTLALLEQAAAALQARVDAL